MLEQECRSHGKLGHFCIKQTRLIRSLPVREGKFMEKEQHATDSGVQESVNTAVETTKNESSAKGTDPVDEKIKQVIGEQNLPAPEETEEKPEDKKDATDPNKKEEEVPEKKEEDSESGKTEEESQIQAPVLGRLEKRIAKLYLSNLILQGKEDDLPNPEDIARSVQGFPPEEKKKALHKLLADQKALRSGTVGKAPTGLEKFPWNRNNNEDEIVDLSEEDHEALVEAEADQKLQEMQGEIGEREWQKDLVKSMEAHPEIDESKKEFNPKIYAAVEKLVLPHGENGQRGMRVSEAYKFVMDSISAAKEEKQQDAEIEKQNALSGAINAGADNARPKKNLSWEEVAEIQANDPARYMQMVRDGELPE